MPKHVPKLEGVEPGPYPFSQVVEANGFVFLAGQVGDAPGSHGAVPGGIEAETRAMLDNVGRLLTAAGLDYTDVVRYAQSKGASATVRFAARAIAWHGPQGPTRGQAKVYVDGRYVKTVDLRRGSFVPRATLFRTSWPAVGRHTLTIVVVGSKGHPMVALDDFTILR